MRVEHRLTITAICPVDKKPDVYSVIVRCARTVKVEDILDAVEDVVKKPAFQEGITQELHRLLACQVETRGTHSGVHTTVICGDAT